MASRSMTEAGKERGRLARVSYLFERNAHPTRGHFFSNRVSAGEASALQSKAEHVTRTNEAQSGNKKYDL
jgi:hypothetical protein